MKHNRLALLLPILALSALGYADQPNSTNEEPADQATKTPFIEYDNRILFWPTHLGYERIKPNAVYTGIETYAIPVIKSGNNKYQYTLLDVEFRLGYNLFFREKDHFTPVVGTGYTQNIWKRHDHNPNRPGILYGLIGFLYWHEFNSRFNLGLNGKFLLGSTVNDKHNWGSPVMGTDISIPITFRLGSLRNWDLCIEPFTLYLHGSHGKQCYVGFRNSVGYRF
jgi:hypothetical protein